MTGFEPDSDSQAIHHLFNHGLRQTLFFGFRKNALNTTPPLFYQVEFTEDAGNNRVADHRHAIFHIFHGKARQESTGTFHFNTVIIESDADRAATLGIITVHQRVDNGFSKNGQRDTPNILATHTGKFCTFVGVLFQEQLNTFYRLWQWVVNFSLIEYFDLTGTTKAAALYPGIIKMEAPFFTKQKHPPHSRHQPTLIVYQQFQRL